MLYPPTNSPILIFSTFAHPPPTFCIAISSETWTSNTIILNIGWTLKCSVVLKRSPFGLQNESFWWAKGVLLKGKRTTIGRQKESFLNFEFWVLNFELFSATPAILNYSILNWCRWQFWILRIVCQTAIIWKGYLCHPTRKKLAEGTCPSTGFALLNVSERLLTIS